MYRRQTRFVVGLVVLLGITSLYGRDKPSHGEEYYQSPFPARTFNEKDLEDLTKKLDYRQKEPKKKKQIKWKMDMQPMQISDKAKSFLYVLVALILLGLFYVLLGKNLFIWFSARKNKTTAAVIRSLDEDLRQAPLEEFLRQALLQKDYQLAIRVRFLMLIRCLQENGKIQWRKYKTNADYLQEMKKDMQYAGFAELTQRYEQAWFGSRKVIEADYLEYDRAAKRLEQQPAGGRVTVQS